MMRGGRVRKSEIIRDIQGLIRTYPSEVVTILRGVPVYNDLGELDPNSSQTTPIYKGEVLIVPVSGAVQRYGLGQVENLNDTILVSGKRDIRQGDYVIIKGRIFQITNAPSFLNAFMWLNITQVSQQTPP
jgi:hypothetical protein